MGWEFLMKLTTDTHRVHAVARIVTTRGVKMESIS
jgi:hypothetical protein